MTEHSEINIEAMKEKVLDILEKHYHGRNHIESRCADEILAFFGVSGTLILTPKDAEIFFKEVMSPKEANEALKKAMLKFIDR